MTPQRHDSTPQQRLEAIEAALRRHLADGRDLAPGLLGDLSRQVEEISRAVSGIPPEMAAACIERARRIRRSLDQLALRLAQQHDETTEDLAHLRKGKATLRAYGRNA